MSPYGDAEPNNLLVATRSALLDALDALSEHRDAVIVIGSQAIYLQTGQAPVALAETTKDADVALDPRALRDDPRIEAAMRAARFYPNPSSKQPGAWMSPAGIPVDLMVPETLAGPGGRTARGARIPPHDRRATRRASGLEATLIDNTPITVTALESTDTRSHTVKVAGLAGLLVAKLHKIAERVGTPDRLNDKDAHDLYRILISTDTNILVTKFEKLLIEPISAAPTGEALGHLQELFAADPTKLGAVMAGRAEEGIGEPETVSLSVSILAADLLAALNTAHT